MCLAINAARSRTGRAQHSPGQRPLQAAKLKDDRLDIWPLGCWHAQGQGAEQSTCASRISGRCAVIMRARDAPQHGWPLCRTLLPILGFSMLWMPRAGPSESTMMQPASRWGCALESVGVAAFICCRIAAVLHPHQKKCSHNIIDIHEQSKRIIPQTVLAPRGSYLGCS